MTPEERVEHAVEMDELIDAAMKQLDKVHGLLDLECLAMVGRKLREARMWNDEALFIDSTKKTGEKS